MMEERYRATTQNRCYPDMSNVNKNITVEAKLISPLTYFVTGSETKELHCWTCMGTASPRRLQFVTSTESVLLKFEYLFDKIM